VRRLFRTLRAALTSSWLWTLVGLALLAALIWTFGPLLAFGEARPLEDEAARLAVIALLVVAWLVWRIVVWRRAARANRLFVAEIAAEPPKAPGEEALAAVASKFQATLDELKRRKLGRRFLREMPWYVIIGPPATGKTTALKQAGLSFPLELHDDLQGVGGTRNCDWFFTEDAVLIDTAGRYTEQASAPEADAREWLGFLDLLKKHRGRRALNGVIVALSADMLAADETALRAHGRTIRKRLAEIMERLEIRLPVYLMLTKADLIRGFEPVFGGLTTAEREQVWGATFPAGGRAGGADAARELELLSASLERKLGPRLDAEERLAVRAEIFRFPAQIAALSEPLRVLFDTIFGESRYEASAWPRGIYLTSATQEGTPIDRLTGALASSFGLPAQPAPPPPRTERRSFFLKDLLVKVIFGEAGLATLAPASSVPPPPPPPPPPSTPPRRSGGSGPGAPPRSGPPPSSSSAPSSSPCPMSPTATRWPRRRRSSTASAWRSPPPPPARRRWTRSTSTRRRRRWRRSRPPGSRPRAASPPRSARPSPARSSGRRTPPTATACGTSSSRGWSRFWRRRCGARSATPTSFSTRSRSTG
jgi:type VI secretion system protein ImpL